MTKDEKIKQATTYTKECHVAIEAFELKGIDMSKSKRLVCELESDVEDVSGIRRSRYCERAVDDVFEIAEFYHDCLVKRGVGIL